MDSFPSRRAAVEDYVDLQNSSNTGAGTHSLGYRPTSVFIKGILWRPRYTAANSAGGCGKCLGDSRMEGPRVQRWLHLK